MFFIKFSKPFLIILIALSLFLSGCLGDQEDDATDALEQTPTATPEKTPDPVLEDTGDEINGEQPRSCSLVKEEWNDLCAMILSEETCFETDFDGDGLPDCYWENERCRRIKGDYKAGNPVECR